MFKKLGWILLGTLVAVPIIAGLVAIKMIQFRTMGEAFAQMVMPPTPVNAIEVREENRHPRLSAVGSVVAVQGTTLKTVTPGVIRDIHFEGGAPVKAGDLLVELDIQVEEAQLRAAEAAVELARISWQRASDLIAKQSISRAELDSASASLKQAEAERDYILRVIDRKRIRAPFDGVLGLRHIQLGQYLDQGSELVTLLSLDPVYVEFSLPQQRLGNLATGLSVTVTANAWPDQVFEGALTAINPDIDPATRNIRVQATLDNPDRKLRPGMFVAIEVMLPETERLLFVPSTAIHRAAFGDSVYVIVPGEAGGMTIEQRPVRLGVRQGDFVAIVEGLSVGEQVVSTGVFKLMPAMPVVIDNSLAPEFSFDPQPGNS